MVVGLDPLEHAATSTVHSTEDCMSMRDAFSATQEKTKSYKNKIE